MATQTTPHRAGTYSSTDRPTSSLFRTRTSSPTRRSTRPANKFLPDLDISQLQPHEQDNARNLTSAILSLPQEDVQLVFSLDVAEGQGVTSGWNGKVTWSKLTDSRGVVSSQRRGWAGVELIGLLGEINGFVQLPASSTDLPPGNSTTQITKLNIHTNGTDSKFLYYSLLPPFLRYADSDCSSWKRNRLPRSESGYHDHFRHRRHPQDH